ncbi:MAG: GGDEF domain-containing protein [Amphritea sp.]
MDQEDWKKKYKSLALEMDELQVQANDDSLQHLVFHMAVALEGQSSMMDRALVSLRDAMKGGYSSKACLMAIKQVDKEVHNLDRHQEKTRAELLGTLQKWIRQLREQVTTDSGKKQLKSSAEIAPEAVAHIEKLPDLLSELLSLQAPLLTRRAQSSIQDFALHSTNNNKLEVADEELLLNKISAELLELISGLYIPQAYLEDAKTQISQIEQGVQLQALPGIIQAMVKLIAAVTSHSSADFENYLLKLTEQLVDVQSFLEESHQDEVAVSRESAQLSQLIRHDVEKIHRVVNDSKDIDQLKRDVFVQLAGIVKSVDKYKRHEEVREKALIARYAKMNDRLEMMEEETLQVKVHMEAERLKALTDPLTSLPNRAAYDEQIASEVARWNRYNHHFSIAVGDLDLFKKINDTYGHLAGDKVLRLIGRILSKRCRITDFVARYGGEEFIIIMPSTTAVNARLAVEKVRLAIENSPFNFHGKAVGITMSFGLAEIQQGESAEDLFDRADKALYKAKRQGRNRIELG